MICFATISDLMYLCIEMETCPKHCIFIDMWQHKRHMPIQGSSTSVNAAYEDKDFRGQEAQPETPHIWKERKRFIRYFGLISDLNNLLSHIILPQEE